MGKCKKCGEELDKDCNGLLRCYGCDGPCLCCYDGPPMETSQEQELYVQLKSGSTRRKANQPTEW